MQPEVERRTFGIAELRAAADEPETDAKDPDKKKPKKMPMIEGYAALFNVKSEEIWGFREIIMPGAFDRALRESHDVRALVNHNPDMILGRTKAGTLKLSIDEKGLRSVIEPPDTTVGRDAVVSLERGDLSQMSFAFRTLTDDWRTIDGDVVRELIDLELFDVSVVAYPAYGETEAQVSQRAKEQAKATAIPPPPDPPASTPQVASGVPNEINEARLKLSSR